MRGNVLVSSALARFNKRNGCLRVFCKDSRDLQDLGNLLVYFAILRGARLGFSGASGVDSAGSAAAGAGSAGSVDAGAGIGAGTGVPFRRAK
ncbi:MAG: hypothetical protein DWB59_01585 [Anaerolineae bacterium]|nr:hypothetical protein [Anaerolineae bacterium]